MAINYPTSLDTFTNPTATSLLTSPSHSVLHSDINDAVEALETKVGIGNTVLGNYTAYTPTFTNLTIGNGTLTAKYCRVNNFVHAIGQLTLGTTSSVSTPVSMTVPVNMSTIYSGITGQPVGTARFQDTGLFIYDGVVASGSSATVVTIRAYNASTSYLYAQNLTSAIPFTWASTDILLWNIYYEAA